MSMYVHNGTVSTMSTTKYNMKHILTYPGKMYYISNPFGIYLFTNTSAAKGQNNCQLHK